MAKKLTAGVLNGTAYKETITVEFNGEEFEVEIRPLNNQEATEVEELRQDGINVKLKPTVNNKMTRSVDFDTKANYRGRKRSDILAVAYGTTDESITEEVVTKEFPPKIVTDVAQRIRQITGIEKKETTLELDTDEESGM